MFNKPLIVITECPSSDDYYSFNISVYGRSGMNFYPLVTDRVTNDDMLNRGQWGYAHTKILEVAAKFCFELCIPTTRVRIKYTGTRTRNLNIKESLTVKNHYKSRLIIRGD